MVRTSLLTVVVLVGCAPAVAVVDKTDDGGEADTTSTLGGGPEAGPEDEGGGGGETGGDGTTTTDDPPEPPPTLASGTWKATAASLEDDPCGWDRILREYYGLDLLDLLPSTFSVEGAEGSFEIRANDYGAARDIECTIGDDDRFTCEEQDVEPTAYDLGRYGWAYEIEFFGTVQSEGLLSAEAIVAYPSADGNTAYYLDQAGIDLDDCTQTFYLELQSD
jgi:hypothetical protein